MARNDPRPHRREPQHRTKRFRIRTVLATRRTALQAGLPLLNFSLIAEEKKQEYFAAVQAGLDKNYGPMERLFAEIIERSLASS
jgi:cell filamentation protein